MREPELVAALLGHQWTLATSTGAAVFAAIWLTARSERAGPFTGPDA